MRFGIGLASAALLAAGCGGSSGSSGLRASAPEDPTPLTKCKIAASADDPLVTEWPASEKARLESLLGAQAVAVQYSGCELRIVEGCNLPGKYAWQRTTLATDTVEIGNEDELYAKLPLGAVSLEGELARSGRIAVRTTIGGQQRLETLPTVPATGACGEVTHVVRAVSVGAFSLLAGGSVSAGGGVGTPLGGGSARTASRELVLREAGDPAQCGEVEGETGPPGGCASPIQLFLAPVRRESTSELEMADYADRRARERGVLVALPAAEDERWSLHDADGRTLCQLPCERWIAPRSGYYLERKRTRDHDAARIDVPNELPHEPKTRVTAEYAPERGQPFWSALTFYGLGIPAGIGGLATFIIGAADEEHRGFLWGASAFYTSIAIASAWWYFYSRDNTFDTYEAGPASRARVNVELTPGGLVGSF